MKKTLMRIYIVLSIAQDLKFQRLSAITAVYFQTNISATNVLKRQSFLPLIIFQVLIFNFTVKTKTHSIIFPSVEMVTTSHGINFPLFCNALFTAFSIPPQHGTSILMIVTLFTSFCSRIAVSFSL